MADTILFRRGNAAQWTLANPTLFAGEPGYEKDTGKFKIGDGTTTWNSLSYASGSVDPAILAAKAPISSAWTANTAVKTGQLITQAGVLYFSNASFTTGSTFSASNFTPLSSNTSGSGSFVVQQAPDGTWPLRSTVTTNLTVIVEWLPYSLALQTSNPPPTTTGYAQGRDRWAVLT